MADVDCGSCGRANRDTAKFCGGCGSPMARDCESCGESLVPGNAFCDNCGSPVVATATTETQAPMAQAPKAQAPMAEAVRKTVTALFCDLVGSTSFGEKVDAESVRDAMGRYHEMAKSVIEANGGTVAKFIGDGVMALFGVPEVAEDDAERAVRTGLALQAEFLEIRSHIADRYGVDLGLRVGINTGEVVIADDDNDIVGDALNTAARLEAACAPGKVLVGESTWRLTRSAVDYSDGHEVEAKGKDDPVSAYEVIEALDAEDELATPFVGRDEELRQLRLVLEDTILERRARLVTVIGAPGVGKTRLAREMRASVEGGTRAFELRCERSGSATFAPVAELLRSVAGITDAHTVEEISAHIGDAVRSLDDAKRIADLLAGFVGAAPMRSTEEMFFAVRRLFEVLGTDQPLVLVVDDIQWAEPLFLDLLEHLAEWVQTVPLMVVCLARPEIREVRAVLTETGRQVSAVVHLEGLSTEATTELAARLIGATELPRDLLAKIPESTEGNPLFVRELMRMLVADGVISNESGSWEMVIDVDAVEVPPTISSLLASRVERMAPDERRVLELAAVVGSEFPMGAVEAAGAGEHSRAALAVTFEQLRRKELIEPTGSYWGDEPVFRFHHVLIRDAAYRRLLKGARAELHTTVGEWTQRSAQSLVGEHEVTIANHFEQAHLLRRQLDLDDEKTKALGEQAAALLHVAATRALEREDLAAAGSLSLRALGCVDDDTQEIAELLLLGCEALLGTGNVADGAPLVDRLAEVAADNQRLNAWIDCFRVERTIYTDPTGLVDAEQIADRAAQRLDELGDQAGVAKARLQRATVMARLGRVGECETELDLALAAARSADDRRRVTAVLGAAPVAALWGPSPVPRAGGRCLDVVRLLRITTGSPAVEATSIRCQAVLEALRGRFDTARKMLHTARTTLEELGLSHDLFETELYAGYVELFADEPVAAEEYLRRAQAGLGQLGIGADAGQATAYLARSLLRQGRLDEAEQAAIESEGLAGENLQTAIVSRSARAEILSDRGEHAASVAMAKEAVRIAEGTDILVNHATAVASLARVLAAAGDAAGAREASTSANALFEAKGAIRTVDFGGEVGVAPASESSGSAGVSPPDPDSASADGSDEWWNSAHELAVAEVEDQMAMRFDSWRARLTDKYIYEDRRPGVLDGAVGGDAAVDYWKAGLVDGNPPIPVVVTPVATRGDNFALVCCVLTPAHSLVELLSLARFTEAGLCDLSVLFDPDDLAAAVEELDRLYCETLDPVEARHVARYGEFMRHFERQDIEALRARFSPDFRSIDNQPTKWPEQDLDGFMVRLESVLDSVETVVGFGERIYAVDPRGVDMVMRVWHSLTSDGSAHERRTIIITRYDTGTDLCRVVESFDESDLERAQARFAEIQAELSSAIYPNLAVQVCGEINVQMRTSEPVLDGLVLDPQRLIDAEPGSHAFGLVERRIIAAGGDRLALLEVQLADGSWKFSVEEIDEAGLLIDWKLFEADALRQAADRLTARWLAIDSDAVLGVVSRFAEAMGHFDVDALAQSMSDDYVGIDHRQISFGELAKDDHLKVFETPDSGSVFVVQAVLSADSNGVLARTTIYNGAAGSLMEGLPGFNVLTVRDGQVTRVEAYEIDDIEAARVCFARLSGSEDGQTDATEWWSPAHRLAVRFIESQMSLDYEVWRGQLTEDVAWEDRRGGAQYVTTGRDNLVEEWKSGVGEATAPLPVVVTPVAVRGDDLALARVLVTPSRMEIEYLVITRYTDDGLNDLGIVFDPDDLSAAVQELDRLYCETLDPFEARSVWALGASLRLFEGGYGDRIKALYASTFTAVDHRQAMWPEQDRDEYLARLDTLLDAGGKTIGFAAIIYVADPELSMYRQTWVTRTSDGAVYERGAIYIHQADAAGSGLAHRSETFDPDDLVGARARLAEIRAARPSSVSPTLAVRVGGDINVQMHISEPWLDRLVADPQRLTDAEPGSHAFGLSERRVLAVRGDKLVLLEVQLPDGSWNFSVEELDESGLLIDWKLFEGDALSEAADEIDARLVGDGDLVLEVGLRFADAIKKRDTETLGLLLSQDYESIDHRQISYGDLNRAETLEVLALPPDGSVGLYRDVEVGAGCLLGWSTTYDGVAGSLMEGSVSLYVVPIRDGQVTRVESYDEEDIDAARACFARLSGSDTEQPAEPEWWNRAHRLAAECTEDQMALRFDAWSDRIAADQVWEDRRAGLGLSSSGRKEAVENWKRGVGEGSKPIPWVQSPVAVRGEHLSLVRLELSPVHMEVEFYELARFNDDGLRDFVILFDTDDLSAAVEELDRLYRETLEPLGAHIVWALGVGLRLVEGGHRDRLKALYTSTFSAVDHRHAMWPEQDRDEYLARLDTLFDVGDKTIGFAAMIYVADRRGISMYRQVWVSRTEEGAAYERRGIYLYQFDVGTGLSESLETFEVDDLDRAYARVAEIRAALPSSVSPNLAVRVGGDINIQMRISEPWLDRLVADPQRLLDAEPGSHGFGLLERRVLAVRGDTLVLLEVQFADRSWKFLVEELDESGLLTEWTLFDATDLVAAADLLDRRWIEVVDQNEGSALVAKYMTAARARDAEAVGLTLSDDYRSVDHRPLGWGEVDRAAIIETFLAPATVETTPVGSEVLAVSESAVLAHSSFLAGPAGSLTEGTVALVVLALGGGKIHSVHLYEPDDIVGARARFDQLSAPPEGDSAQGGSWSRADRLTTEAIQDQMGLRIDEWAARLAPDVVFEDRRSMFAHETEGREGFVEMWLTGQMDDPQPLEVTLDSVAIRGDDLVLARCLLGLDGLEVEFLQLNRWTDDDLCDLWLIFDPDDLGGAVDELNRLHLESLEPSERMATAAAMEVDRFISSREPDRNRARLDPSVVIVDHRTLGWPDLDAAAFEEKMSFEEFVEQTVGVTRRIHAVSPVGWCKSLTAFLTMENGAKWEMPTLLVSMVDPDSGLLIRTEIFEDGQLTEALARFAELEESAQNRITPSLAVLAGGQVNRQVRCGDPFEDLVAETVTDGTAFGIVDRKVLSVHGDHLALIACTTDDSEIHFSVEEVDADGLLVGCTLFPVDDLRAAADYLDDRHLEIDDQISPAVRGGYASMKAHRHSDIEALERILSTDYVFEDHRGFSYPTLDRDGYMEGVKSLADFGGVLLGPEIMAATKWCVLSSGLIVEYDGGARLDRQPCLAVTTGDETGISRQELFPEDALEEALARFDELAGEGDSVGVIEPPGASTGHFGDPVSVVIERRHRGDFAAHLADDYEEISSQTLHAYTRNKDEAMRDFDELLTMSSSPRLERRYIAVSGDLVRVSHRSVDHGTGFITEFLTVSLHRADGKLRRHFRLDPDDVAEALQIAARESGQRVVLVDQSVREAAVPDTLREAYRAQREIYATSDLARIAAETTTDDFTFEGRRRLLQQRGGRDEYAKNLAAMAEDFDLSGLTGEVLAVSGDRTDLIQTTYGDDHNFSLAVVVSRLGEAGLLQRLVSFDSEDVEAALNELESLGGAPAILLDPSLAEYVDLPRSESPTPPPPVLGPSNDADRWLRADPSLVLEDGEALGRTLAVLSDNSAMHELSTGHFLVTSWMTSGEPLFAVRYPHDEFYNAGWELHELGFAYGAFQPSPEWRAIFQRWGITLQEENWDAARDMLAEDYVAVSHQLLEAGLVGGFSRDQMIRMIQNLKADPGDDVRLIVSEIHAGSDLGVLMSEDFVTIDAEGWDISRGGVSMIQFGDGVMLRAERWDDADLAAALARFDEIHTEAGLPPSERFSDPAKALEASTDDFR